MGTYEVCQTTELCHSIEATSKEEALGLAIDKGETDARINLIKDWHIKRKEGNPMAKEEIEQMADMVAEKVTREAILCGSYGYEFSSHIGKAMRELHLLEAHKIGFPSGAIFIAERASGELGYCTGIPISERDKITAKLYLAQERVAKGEPSLARLAVEEANDIMARELALAKGRIEI